MTFNIVRNDKIWYAFSGLLCVLSIIAIGVFGLNLGIDFTGGTLMTIQSEETLDPQVLRERILSAEAEVNQLIAAGTAAPLIPAEEAASSLRDRLDAEATTDSAIQLPTETVVLGDPQIIPAGDNATNIKLRATDEYTHQMILRSIREVYPSIVEQKFETIGPSVGASVGQKALIALVVAIVAIIAYITFAFRKVPKRVQPWKFGVVTVGALVHDILITVGIFAVLGAFLNVEITTLFVTALLTVLGYSVNDTIVVFDRIRENLKHQKRGEHFVDIAEKSLQQTLARSINTSVTLLVVLLALFFFGDASIQWFVLAMIIGTITGTYSSIFLATPVLARWNSSK